LDLRYLLALVVDLYFNCLDLVVDVLKLGGVLGVAGGVVEGLQHFLLCHAEVRGVRSLTRQTSHASSELMLPTLISHTLIELTIQHVLLFEYHVQHVLLLLLLSLQLLNLLREVLDSAVRSIAGVDVEAFALKVLPWVQRLLCEARSSPSLEYVVLYEVPLSSFGR